jgi:predicted ATPase
VQDELNRQLLTLQRAELIREAARIPELEYIFRHSLTQEAAYSTILLRQRREFHRQVGEAIENLFPDRLDEFAPMLAHHFGEANDSRAVRYESLAGDAAFQHSASMRFRRPSAIMNGRWRLKSVIKE